MISRNAHIVAALDSTFLVLNMLPPLSSQAERETVSEAMDRFDPFLQLSDKVLAELSAKTWRDA